MSKVNRLPRGLQGLLFNRNFGVNPSELRQDISPGLDLYPFYSANSLNAAAGFVVATAKGDNFTISQPQDEIWEVHSFALKGINNAGNAAEASMMVEISAPNPEAGFAAVTQSIVTSGPLVPLATGQDINYVERFTDRRFFPPGTAFVFEIGGIALGGAPSMTFSGALLYTRWPI